MALAIPLIVMGSQPAEAQYFTTLHSFGGRDGALPAAGLTMDAAGNLYGTTYNGGTAGYGSVFKLVHTGGSWILHPLYSFQSGNDGAEPQAGVTIGPDGNLYGTTTRGGGSAASGTIFKLSPPASVCRSTICPWIETILYRFSGGSDGNRPMDPVVFDRVGNLYGTTWYGGSDGCGGSGCGVVFKLTRSGSSWTETVLYSFQDSPDGAYPISGLVFDQAGNLYGTTSEGGGGSNCSIGTTGCGTVFQLAPSGSGWTETVLYRFTGEADGSYASGGLIFDNAGNLYGTTVFGLTGNGTVFELTPSGGQWTYTLLYTLMSGESFEGGPLGTLAMDTTGNLYGTTFEGGYISAGLCVFGCGTVFKLAPFGGGWIYSLLYRFIGSTDGALPYDGLILDRNGHLYGTTSEAGAGGQGTVFELTP
jgi:uncharacterized repeat protein (TIGR03803 family)